MDEQTLKMLYELGALGEEGEGLKSQLEFARALRMNEPKLNGTRAGRTFVADSPLAHLGAVLNRQAGNREMRDIGTKQDAIRGKQTAARGAFDRLRRTPGINPQEDDMQLYGNNPYGSWGM